MWSSADSFNGVFGSSFGSLPSGGLPTFWGDTVLAMTRLDWILLALIFVVLGLWRFLLKPLG